MFVTQQLFEVLQAYRNSYLSEFHAYETIDFNNEYDSMSNEEESNDEDDDYVKNQFMEMKNIIGWIDEHRNYSFSTI